MSRQLHIRPDALADIEQAADWYDSEEPGVGEEFIQAVREMIHSLAKDPEVHRIRDRRWNVRWCYPPRFPYRIVYRVHERHVTVVAVIHASRHDREWKGRV